MQLDLFRNELVFANMKNSSQFAKTLQAAKGIKFRKYKDKFYVPLAHLESARYVLRDYSGMIQFTINYELFAKRFVVNKDPIHIKWNPASCEISGQGIPWDLIIPKTSYFTKAALQSKAYERNQWDGTVQLFDTKYGTFPSGLLEYFIEAFRERSVPYTIERTFNYPGPEYQLNPTFEFTPTKDQIDSVAALSKANNGIAKLPTGFGKTSFVAASLIAEKGVKSMFLANQRVLINDAKDDFKSVFQNDDIHIGTIGDGEFDPGDITVASIQGVRAALNPPSVQEKQETARDLEFAKIALLESEDDEVRALAEKNIKRLTKRTEKMQWRTERSVLVREFLKGVKLFIVDESQVLGTDMWNEFLYACPAPYRYTLSATDTRTDGGRVQIVAATGERRYESSAAEQIEKGRLSEFRGYFKRFDHGLDKDLMRGITMNYKQGYDLFLTNNTIRNNLLIDQLVKWAKEGNSVLGLVTYAAHAQIIIDMMLQRGLPEHIFEYVDGKTPKKKRQDAITRFRNSEYPILLGTSIFDVGFNAKNASKIVRFNAGGSEVREPQRAGRTVRKREDDSWGESFDILDVNVPFFESQSWKRIKYLKEEFGDERIKILPGEVKGDFDIVSLNDIVNAIPNETDRFKAEAIIQQMQKKEEFEGEEFAKMEGLDELENNKDLKHLLDQLRFEF